MNNSTSKYIKSVSSLPIFLQIEKKNGSIKASAKYDSRNKQTEKWKKMKRMKNIFSQKTYDTTK